MVIINAVKLHFHEKYRETLIKFTISHDTLSSFVTIGHFLLRLIIDQHFLSVNRTRANDMRISPLNCVTLYEFAFSDKKKEKKTEKINPFTKLRNII